MSDPLRDDLKVMASLVPEGASLLDVGCGEGELLAWLSHHQNTQGRGLEQKVEAVSQCIGKGLAVTQADAEEELPYYSNDSYDFVVLSRSLQAMSDPVAVLNHVVRIGKQAIISIPNFSYWRNRLYLGFRGRMPVTQTLQYDWFDTPNIHFCTIVDFIELCQKQNITIEKRIFHGDTGKRKEYFGNISLANLLAEQATFLVSK